MKSATRTPAALSPRVAELFNFVVFYNKFRNIRRVIYTKGSADREPLGEHTDQLAFFAWFVRDLFLPHLDLSKVLCYSLAHDVVEVYAEDTSAFPDKLGHFGHSLDRSTKKDRERRALERLVREWGQTFPAMIEQIRAYERREDEESRFVYALDKFVADLNILEDEGRTNLLLGVTFDEKVAYKRPRIAEHELLVELFDEFCEYCSARPELYYQPETTAAE